MQVPAERSFRDLEDNEIARANAVTDSRLDKMARIAPDAISCHVAVSRPQVNQRTGSPFRAVVRVTMPPHKELVATKDPQNSDANRVDMIIREAFDAVERQIKEVAERRDDHTTHARRTTQPIAFVVRLFRNRGYGFIRTPDGEELYFHRNSVTGGDFDRLTVGTQVSFVGANGHDGAQTSTVRIIDKRGERRSSDGAGNALLPESWKAQLPRQNDTPTRRDRHG